MLLCMRCRHVFNHFYLQKQDLHKQPEPLLLLKRHISCCTASGKASADNPFVCQCHHSAAVQLLAQGSEFLCRQLDRLSVTLQSSILQCCTNGWQRVGRLQYVSHALALAAKRNFDQSAKLLLFAGGQEPGSARAKSKAGQCRIHMRSRLEDGARNFEVIPGHRVVVHEHIDCTVPGISRLCPHKALGSLVLHRATAVQKHAQILPRRVGQHDLCQ